MSPKPSFRGYYFHVRINNIDDFQRVFKVSNQDMADAGAHGFTEHNDYDVNVIRKILNKMRPNFYMVRVMNRFGDGYDDYFYIYTKQHEYLKR